MPVDAQCPNPSCAKRYSVPDTATGRTIRCKTCGQTFVVDSQTVIRPQSSPSVGVASSTVIVIGQSLGRFVIREELGAGAFGTVYRAFDPVLKREVALKVLKAEVAANASRVERFLREAKAAAGLHHPHIVAVFDAGQDGGRYYIASAFIAGKPLADAIPEGGAKFKRAAKLVRELAEALAYAHEQGVVHRDVKPANAMLDEQDRVHLMDFGLAARSDEESKLTKDGAVMGTPAYMSPEQAEGQKGEARPATDQYAVGVVLYELLTGHVPFTGPVPIVIHNVIHTEPEPPRKFRADIPVDLETICLKAMSKRPEDRYANCQELADDLRRWLEGEPVTARPLPRWERVVRWVRRNPALASAGVLGVVVMVLGLITASVIPLWFRAESAKSDANRARDIADTERDEARKQRQVADEQKAVAVRLKGIADQQRNVAVDAKKDADVQRKAAETARDEVAVLNTQLEGFNYGRTIQVAHQAWRNNNVTHTRALLDSTKPHLRGWEWHYVNRICDGSLLTLKGHTGSVYSASFSADGSRIVTCSLDRTAKVWAAKTGNEILTLKGHTDYVVSASFSADGSRIVTCGGNTDRTAKVWNATTGNELLTLKGHTNGGQSAAFSADGTRIVTASSDKTAKVWDAKTGAEILTLKGHAHTVTSASFNMDGSRIVTSSTDRTAKVWDTKTGNEILTLKGHEEVVRSASFSADGTRIVTSSHDKTAKVWDAKTGAEILILKGHEGFVRSASFNADGTRIVTGSSDATAKVWNVPSAKSEEFAKTINEAFTLKGHTSDVHSASFSADGERIVTSSGAGIFTTNGDKTAKVWDARTGAEFLALKGDTDDVVSASFSADGERIVTGSFDRPAKVWDAKTGNEILTLKGRTSSVRAVAYKMGFVAFNADGTRIVTAGSFPPMGAKVWDAKTGNEILTLKGHTSNVYSASFSADGARIVTSSLDRTAKVWDAKTGNEILTLKGHEYRVFSASFSTDGARIVTGSEDKTAKLWDAKTGNEILTLKGHTSGVLSASFSADGARIATSCSDGTAKVWDAKTGNELLTLKGHTDAVMSASFNVDGSRIVTSSNDKTAKVWDAKTGAEVFSLSARTGLSFASFSNDGSRIITGGLNEMVKVFDARPFGK